MKTKAEIIEETVAAYADPSNRAIDEDGICEYSYNGKYCAVGRVLLEPHKYFGAIDCLASKSDCLDIPYANIHLLFKEEYRGHEIAFWSDLQSFHDSSSNWSDKGLTEGGHESLSRIKSKWI